MKLLVAFLGYLKMDRGRYRGNKRWRKKKKKKKR